MNDEERRALLARTESLLQVQRFAEALEIARSLLATEPANAGALVVATRALLGLEDRRGALAMAERAVTSAPNSAHAHRLCSVALGQQRHEGDRFNVAFVLDRSVSHAETAVRLAPSEALGYSVLAEAYVRVGDLTSADAAIRIAIRLAPLSAGIWASASAVAIRARNLRAAKVACHRALEIDPANYVALNNLGVAMRASGHFVHSSKAFAGAAAQAPTRTTARHNLSLLGTLVIWFAALLVLSPIVLVPHGIYVWYWLGVLSLVVIRRDRRVAVAAERWAAPIALRMSRLQPNRSMPTSVPSSDPARSWSATWGNYRVRTSLLVSLLAPLWFIASLCLAVVLAALVIPGAHGAGPAAALGVLVFIALITTVPTVVVIRRLRKRRQPMPEPELHFALPAR